MCLELLILGLCAIMSTLDVDRNIADTLHSLAHVKSHWLLALIFSPYLLVYILFASNTGFGYVSVKLVSVVKTNTNIDKFVYHITHSKIYFNY